MAFFIGLLFFYGIYWLLSLAGISAFEDNAIRGAYAAASMFILVGFSHFAKPEKLEAMIPSSWPYKRALNYISGLAEILLAVGLLFAATREYAAYGLLLLLIAVFPANINVARKKANLYNVSRLFFQPFYMLWVYWFCIHLHS